MAFSYTYNWDSTADASDWTFVGPGGSGLLTSTTGYRYWCFDTNDTPSGNVGPTSGQGGNPDGYVYTEASTGTTPTETEIFTMTFNTTFDTTNSDVVISFYTNQRGDFNDSVCYAEVKTGFAWIILDSFGGASDPDKVATGGTDVWVLRTIAIDPDNAFHNGSAAQFRIRIESPVSSGNHWHNDYGIDSISIVGADRVTQTHQMII